MLLPWQLIPWSCVFLEKLPLPQLLWNLPTFYGTRMFNTIFRRIHRRNRARLIGNVTMLMIGTKLTAVITVRTLINVRVTYTWMRSPRGSRFEYLYRSPASRRRRRKGNPVPGRISGPPCSWGIWMLGYWPPGSGSLESEAAKYGHDSRGTRTQEWLRWRGPAEIINNRPVLSSAMAPPHQQTRSCLTIIKIFSWNQLETKTHRLVVT
jgi:hypothetical protein